MEHGSAAARPAHHVDAVPRARIKVDIVERLHPAEAQARGRKPIEAHRARYLAVSTCLEERHVASHVLVTRRRRVDDQLEPLPGRSAHQVRH
jgi:hypothetical protein